VNDAYTASIRIDARPTDVFPFLIDPALIVRWMGDWAQLDATPGGELALDINGVPIRGEYLVVDPPHRVVFTWGVAGSETIAPGSTTVEIQLHPDGDGTRLELAHRDLPPEELAKHDSGWTHFLARLAIAGAGGDPGPDAWAET
jgi:uncharacterized protein YndB with AHSA1/START domain